MKKFALVLLVFALHVNASDETQVGTFDTGVSSKKVKIGKKYKAPIEEAKTYQIDINESEIEGITTEPKVQKEEVVKQEKKEELVVTKKEPIKIEKQKSQNSDVSESDGGGVVLPFDKVDEKSGVVLPMDEEKKGGFFSIFGF